MLNMSSNSLKLLPAAMGVFTKLKTLRVDGNRLEVVADVPTVVLTVCCPSYYCKYAVFRVAAAAGLLRALPRTKILVILGR